MPEPIIRTRTNSRVMPCKYRSLASTRLLECGCGCADCKCFACYSINVPEGTECVTDTSGKVESFIECGDVRNCAVCDFYEAAEDRHKWPYTVEAAIAEIQGPLQHRDKEWAEATVIQWAHRDLLDKAAAKDYPVPPLSGRGIVIVANGKKYFDCAYVSAFMLRNLGCKLPIQFWYTGERNMTDLMRSAAANLGVECVNSEAFPKPRIMGGWQLKPFAIIHSLFAETILMDADNLPVVDPTYLFDDPRYLEAGAIFWPDIPTNTAACSPEAWAVANLDYQPLLVESGFIVVNKQKHWKPLQVAMHMNEHSDFWYQDNLMYGDQNTFLLAWIKTGSSFLIVPQNDFVGQCFQERDLDGKYLSNHCCQGKEGILNGTQIPGVINQFLAMCGTYHRRHFLQPKKETP